MQRRVALLLLGVVFAPTPGCQFDSTSLGVGANAPGSDASAATDPDAGSPAVDAMKPPDDGDACEPATLSFTPSNLTKCQLPAALGSIQLGLDAVGELDTNGSGELVIDGVSVAIGTQVVGQPGGPDVLIIAANALTMAPGSELTVTGGRPLVIVVYGSASIAGRLFAGARGTASGPGATPATCGRGSPGALQIIETGAAGGSGGGGGGFGQAGGLGARVRDDGADSKGGGQNGKPGLSPLRGGCPGGRGGGPTGGAPGGAGGAIHLAAESITVTDTGIITAPGGGGQGATGQFGGGGGGGSGGAIILEAPDIAVDGAVAANGGGAGEGARRSSSGGESGDDGRDDANTANGGDEGSGNGGDGGDGGADDIAAESGDQGNHDDDAGGSGGGGGSVGRIFLGIDSDPELGGVVSPPGS